jgi:hypothetical protein
MPLKLEDYKERISYDTNGNILTYHRNMQNAAAMDELKYNYYSGTNKLEYVYDTVAGKPSGNDISSQNAGNLI